MYIEVFPRKTGTEDVGSHCFLDGWGLNVRSLGPTGLEEGDQLRVMSMGKVYFVCQVVSRSDVVSQMAVATLIMESGWCITVSFITGCDTLSSALNNTVRLSDPVYFGTVGVLRLVMKETDGCKS